MVVKQNVTCPSSGCPDLWSVSFNVILLPMQAKVSHIVPALIDGIMQQKVINTNTKKMEDRIFNPNTLEKQTGKFLQELM